MKVFRQASASVHTSGVYWACQLLGWGLNGCGQVYSAMVALHVPLARAIVEIVILNATALALTHLLRRFMRRHGWAKLGIRALLPRNLVASVLLALPLAVIMHFMEVAALWSLEPIDDALVQRIPAPIRAIDPLLLHTINWSGAFFFWIALYFGITSLRDRHAAELRQSELTRALQLAELRLLKSQLNPHFLFNSLNSVRALIAEDPSGAQNAVTQLARTLRYTLGSGQEELVTLERELEIVEDYLALESLRFGERLRIERHIATGAQGVRIPVMLLQTVVENAIKHGIAELPCGGVLRVSAMLHGDALHIEVENPRPANAPLAGHEGLGLRNAAERLRLLFGSRASLELDLSRADLADARICVPQNA